MCHQSMIHVDSSPIPFGSMKQHTAMIDSDIPYSNKRICSFVLLCGFFK